MTEKRDSSNTVLQKMTYDAEDRLVAVGKTSFVYDFTGRVVKAVRSDGSTTLYPTTSYEVDKFASGETHWHSYLEHRGRRAVYTKEKDAEGKEKYIIRYFHTDHLGSTIAVTDPDGKVVTTYEYDPFGQVTVKGSDVSRYKYSGKEIFEGLYYFGARFYDPEVRK
jgi:YD repeat-containing protein